MGNNKITKIGIVIALALAGGVNYFSFSDMGNNIDNHVIEPIKISMEKSRIEEARLEKEKEEKIKVEEEIKSKKLERELAKLREENKAIAEQNSLMNKKIIDDMNKSRDTPVIPVINYTIPNKNNANNATYMTAFGVSSSAETVKAMGDINPENYIIYKNTNDGAVFAILEKNENSQKEYKGLSTEANNKYTRIMISQSGQQYLLEDRCKTLGNDINWLKIIPDSPSVLSKSNQVCSLLPILDKDNKESARIIEDEFLNSKFTNNIKPDRNDINKNLDFSRYKNTVEKSKSYYSFGGKSGNVKFNIKDGIVISATGGDEGTVRSSLNDYYNSVMISSDRQNIFLYNKLCAINFSQKNAMVKMSDYDNNEQYFIGNDKGLITNECAVLPLIKSQD